MTQELGPEVTSSENDLTPCSPMSENLSPKQKSPLAMVVDKNYKQSPQPIVKSTSSFFNCGHNKIVSAAKAEIKHESKNENKNNLTFLNSIAIVKEIIKQRPSKEQISKWIENFHEKMEEDIENSMKR